MRQFKVTYYYCATGTEGPNIEDYGIVTAESKDAAIDIILSRNYPVDLQWAETPQGYIKKDVNEDSRNFLKSCLTAKEVCHAL